MDINSMLKGLSTPNKSVTSSDTAVARKTDGKTAEAPVATLATSAEKVTITSAASLIGQMAQPTISNQSNNAERIASLRSAILEGSYRPNPERIAQRLAAIENLLRAQ